MSFSLLDCLLTVAVMSLFFLAACRELIQSSHTAVTLRKKIEYLYGEPAEVPCPESLRSDQSTIRRCTYTDSSQETLHETIE